MISIGANDWRCDGLHLKRTYYFSGLKGSQSKTFQVDCLFDPSTSACQHVAFTLQPFHLLRKELLNCFIFFGKLSTGYSIDLVAASAEYAVAEFATNSLAGAELCLGALRTGGDIQLAIGDGVTKIGNFPIPNDVSFDKIYQTMRQGMSRSRPGVTEIERKEEAKTDALKGDDYLDHLLKSIEWSAERLAEPFHPDLHKQAELNVGPHNPRAIIDEYHRLLYLRLHPKRRSLWSRLSG